MSTISKAALSREVLPFKTLLVELEDDPEWLKICSKGNPKEIQQFIIDAADRKAKRNKRIRDETEAPEPKKKAKLGLKSIEVSFFFF